MYVHNSKPLTSKNVLSSSTVGLVPGTISEGGFKVVVEFSEFLGLSLTLKTSKKSYDGNTPPNPEQ